MTRQEKLLWSLLAGGLVILFLLSSTDLIIKEKKVVIYPVSVIISDTSDDYYSNFRKGADKAAEEYNADVSFITLYEEGDPIRQMELVKREIDDGASAVVLFPVNPVECGKILDEMILNSPVIVMGSPLPNDQVKGAITTDHEEEGRLLGQAIIKEDSPDQPVTIICSDIGYGYNKDIYSSLSKTLEEAGFPQTLYEKPAEEVLVESSGEAVVAAIDVKSLDQTADILSGNPEYGGSRIRLYGIGSTTKILTELDRGRIKGLVISDQFDAGYMSIEKAVKAVHKGVEKEEILLESHYITKEHLRESRFERILYPID